MDVVCLLLEHITGVKYLAQNKEILNTRVESRLDRVREFVLRDGDDTALANNLKSKLKRRARDVVNRN